MFGINDAGDFDQLSLSGVDFGTDYCEDLGIIPTFLEGDETMYGRSSQQLGYANGMGIVPEGMAGDFEQLGIVPDGMSGDHQQLGLVPSGLGGRYHQQMGSHNYQMGFMDKLQTPLFSVAGFSITPVILAGVAGALWFAKRQGYLKKFGL